MNNIHYQITFKTTTPPTLPYINFGQVINCGCNINCLVLYNFNTFFIVCIRGFRPERRAMITFSRHCQLRTKTRRESHQSLSGVRTIKRQVMIVNRIHLTIREVAGHRRYCHPKYLVKVLRNVGKSEESRLPLTTQVIRYLNKLATK